MSSYIRPRGGAIVRQLPHQGNSRFIVPNRFPGWGTPPVVPVPFQTMVVGTNPGNAANHGYADASFAPGDYGSLAPTEEPQSEINITRIRNDNGTNQIVINTLGDVQIAGGGLPVTLNLDNGAAVGSVPWNGSTAYVGTIPALSAYITSKVGSAVLVRLVF